jgi:adenosylcobinamide-GDP ribazoletransferase
VSFLYGFLINLQFFTIIPIRAQLPMNPVYIRRAVQTFPLLGILQGACYAGCAFVLLQLTPFSELTAAFCLWLLTIVVTGGLHLDGWIDSSDAFFSYRDVKRRLDIMNDPRTGVFGVISVILLLSCRFFFIYEIILNIQSFTFILIALIPYLSRNVMGIMLTNFQLAKRKGLAFFFQESSGKGSIKGYIFYSIIIGLILWVIAPSFLRFSLILLAVSIVALLFLKKRTIKWFGGITGDVVGASVEGVELILWMTLWLLHYFVTV